MRISKFNDSGTLGKIAASIVMAELRHNPELLLCAATGSSPIPLYHRLGKEVTTHGALFHKLRIIPLDEWVGLQTSEGSCDAFLQEYLILPLKISKERYLRFNVKVENLGEECMRIQGLLESQGPIDLCILGLGKNGHLGLNEPSDRHQSHCHIVHLTPESRQHAMVADSKIVPTHGLTLGMKDILASKRILLLVSGTGKEKVKQQLFSGTVDPYCPASYLWKHNNVDCLVVE